MHTAPSRWKLKFRTVGAVSQDTLHEIMCFRGYFCLWCQPLQWKLASAKAALGRKKEKKKIRHAAFQLALLIFAEQHFLLCRVTPSSSSLLLSRWNTSLLPALFRSSEFAPVRPETLPPNRSLEFNISRVHFSVRVFWYICCHRPLI